MGKFLDIYWVKTLVLISLDIFLAYKFVRVFTKLIKGYGARYSLGGLISICYSKPKETGFVQRINLILFELGIIILFILTIIIMSSKS